MKNLGQMMRQAQEMQERLAQMQAKMAELEVTGTAGGGLVQVTLTGKTEAKRVKIDPSLFDGKEVGVIEDLLVAAFNDARGKTPLQVLGAGKFVPERRFEPLDFMAVTDHSEFLGVLNQLDDPTSAAAASACTASGAAEDEGNSAA